MQALTSMRKLAALSLICNLMLPVAGYAAGLLKPANGAALEIKTQDVNVVIEDGYATTKVEQVFHNPHAQDLEAVYSFPVPQKAAVAEFTLWIDGQPVTGEVLERKQAQQVYATEKAAGRDAGITEKDEYRTFDIRVSLVRAGADTRIRLVYMQALQVDTGIGRYVYPLEDGGVDSQQRTFWTANQKVKENFSFNVQFKSSYPIDALRLPKHPQAIIHQINDDEWSVQLNSSAAVAAAPEPGEKTQVSTTQAAFTLDQDIVVYWRHKADLPGSVDLVTYKPAGSSRGS